MLNLLRWHTVYQKLRSILAEKVRVANAAANPQHTLRPTHCLAQWLLPFCQSEIWQSGEQRIEELLAGPASAAGTTGLHVTAAASTIQVKRTQQ